MHLDALMKRLGLIYKVFDEHFQGKPSAIVLAPGRVYLLGEHTDYNEGFVLPVAVDLNVLLAVRPREDRQVFFHVIGMRKEVHFSLDAIHPKTRSPWTREIQSIAWLFQHIGYALSGLEGVVHWTLPPNASMGFPSPLGVAVAWAWRNIAQWDLSRMEIAKIVMQAERRFIPNKSGEADPLVSAVAREGHALCVDCRDNAVSYHPLPPQASIVICEVNIRSSKASHAYASRKKQCETIVQILQEDMPHIRALRDVETNMLTRYRDRLPGHLYRRALHVVTENQRVLQGVQALKHADVAALGRLMNSSHRSLREDYELSSPELDALWLAANEVPGCYGARMSATDGGKYVIALIHRRALGRFRTHVEERFHSLTGKEVSIRVLHASGGVMTL